MRAYFVMAGVIMLAALSAGCTAPKSEAAERAQVLAAGMNAITPKDVGGGTTMTSVRADDASLILTFEGIDSRELALPDFETQIVEIICSDQGFRSVLAKDVAIMIELIANDGQKAEVGVKQCG